MNGSDELGDLYRKLRRRVSVYSPNSCVEVSLKLPIGLEDELAFHLLVNWAYVLLHEAARIPLAFLTQLPPLRADNSFRREVSRLRNYLVHNLDVRKTRDRKTRDFVQRWFKDACGYGTISSAVHYGDCCSRLAHKLREFLKGAIDACDLLDDPEDGTRLVDDLKDRVDLAWNVERFDQLVVKCAARTGNPGIDLVAFRNRYLEGWRQTLALAKESDRETVVEQQIEADLVAAIGYSLPHHVREGLERVAASPDAVAASLLLLRDAQRVGGMKLPEILDHLSTLQGGSGQGTRRPPN
ncbi:MAG: hypothetical protein OXP11_05890 [Gammaproteobacteria bacterium]|nr:hypothetical protein [Gammaproteobacteria bacterium]